MATVNTVSVFPFQSSFHSIPVFPQALTFCGLKMNTNNSIKALINEEEEPGLYADEEFREEFQCCVCLDLLFKPVVLGCGHISCFWCVFNSMDWFQESHCPLCRHPYNHFPSICQLLHFLLLKLYPIAYKRRERQVREEEKKVGHSSPEFDQILFKSHPIEESHAPCNSPHPSLPRTSLYSNSFSSTEGESLSSVNLSQKVQGEDSLAAIPATSSRSSGAMVTTNATIQECNLLGNDLGHGTNKQVSVTDLLCAICKQLLFRPVVLNCGHVYCESCIIIPMEGIPRCQVCQSLHPNGFPSVCLILEHFLEEQFSEIYVQRREALLNRADCSTQVQHVVQSSCVPTKVYSSWLLGSGPKIHIGVGCDYCGMSPIIGERYKCKNCIEKIGFDLCEACYSNPSKLPGRFNQQHKPEHKFEIVQPVRFREFLSN